LHKNEIVRFDSEVFSPSAELEAPHEPTIKPEDAVAKELKSHLLDSFQGFRWKVRIRDWIRDSYEIGGDELYWPGQCFDVWIKTQSAARQILAGNTLKILDSYIDGEIDFEGNLYALAYITDHLKLEMTWFQKIASLVTHSAFQNGSRAKANVKSHYDIPAESLNAYLDQVYRAYSCGIFKDWEIKEREELVRVGKGEEDEFDSLEKAQWRKFKDAVNYIDPEDGENLLDVGCGYGGQLIVALENYPFSKVVGWTFSNNQVTQGKDMLSRFDPGTWEINEGDYRSEKRIFDNITSTGMVSHVGPRGLTPYVRNIRRMIKPGGRYVHHSLMEAYSTTPHNFKPGRVFHKKYVWPGFHWFTLGQHIKALEKNGFVIEGVRNLSNHYGKTIACWNERFLAKKELMHQILGDATYRAWKVYLAGSSAEATQGQGQVCRIYCKAK